MGIIRDQPLNLAPASVRDYRRLARRRIPRQLFDYIDGGSYEESTMAANESDLRETLLRQRVMVDVSHRKTGVSLLGSDWTIPVALAPVGLAGMFATRAEVQAAKAAEKFGIPFCESTVSIAGIEEVAAEVSAPFWYQLYVMRDRSYAEDLMGRAQSAGCETLVLTVDLPVVGERYRDTRNGMVGSVSKAKSIVRAIDFATHPLWVRDVALGGKPLTFGNLEKAVPGASRPDEFKGWVDDQFDPSVTWDDLKWVRENWSGTVVLKGIMDPDDAIAARDHGADAIVVSNHGGRQLDNTPSTVSALPSIASAVGDDLDVLVDGGIRSGLDIVKMLALGAKSTLVGRAWAFAVAAGGESAVSAVLETMRTEMEVAMGLLGVNEISELCPELLVSHGS